MSTVNRSNGFSSYCPSLETCKRIGAGYLIYDVGAALYAANGQCGFVPPTWSPTISRFIMNMVADNCTIQLGVLLGVGITAGYLLLPSGEKRVINQTHSPLFDSSPVSPPSSFHTAEVNKDD